MDVVKKDVQRFDRGKGEVKATPKGAGSKLHKKL